MANMVVLVGNAGDDTAQLECLVVDGEAVAHLHAEPVLEVEQVVGDDAGAVLEGQQFRQRGVGGLRAGHFDEAGRR